MMMEQFSFSAKAFAYVTRTLAPVALSLIIAGCNGGSSGTTSNVTTGDTGTGTEEVVTGTEGA